jgi:hypothetical protein
MVWVFHPSRKSSTTEAPSTEPNYNPSSIPYNDPYNEKISYGD